MSHVERALRLAAHEPDADRAEIDKAATPLPDSLGRYPVERAAGTARPSSNRAPAERPNVDVVVSRLPRDARLVTASAPDAISVEQYGRLAAVLHQAAAARPLKNVIVSSAVPREGKTLTAANLALTLGQAYHVRVLLVDADLRNPTIHQLFGIPNAIGVAEVLDGRADDPPLVEVPGSIALLTAGRPAGSPMGALASPRMKRLLDSVVSSFDWVVIDTPPVGLLPDAQFVARHADGVLLVVAAGDTSYKLVRRAIEMVGPERLLGTILNRADPATIPTTPYYRHYARGSNGRGGG
jgi:capsular exopolysaccharide synthesis family protein